MGWRSHDFTRSDLAVNLRFISSRSGILALEREDPEGENRKQNVLMKLSRRIEAAASGGGGGVSQVYVSSREK